jgi:hypothetical protein
VRVPGESPSPFRNLSFSESGFSRNQVVDVSLPPVWVHKHDPHASWDLEAVKLIKERGVGYVQAARYLGVHLLSRLNLYRSPT